eukprot:13177754-Ditylum_brightwellii.AAC.1
MCCTFTVQHSKCAGAAPNKAACITANQRKVFYLPAHLPLLRSCTVMFSIQSQSNYFVSNSN